MPSCTEANKRECIVNAETGSPISADCGQIWRDLVEGRARVLGYFTDRGSAFVAIQTGLNGRAIRGRDLEILQRIVMGDSAKSVAIDFDVSPSTVAVSLKTSLETFGVVDRPSRMPLALAMLGRAACHPTAIAMTLRNGVKVDGVECALLNGPVTDLRRLLPPAVLEVVHLQAEGRSHAEIAAQRRTSVRTVANQLASAFQRLGVSGRSQMLERLIITRADMARPTQQMTKSPLSTLADTWRGGVAESA